MPAGRPVAAGKCGTCHPNGARGISPAAVMPGGGARVSCHGGTDTVLELAHGHGKGFILAARRARRSRGPPLCGFLSLQRGADAPVQSAGGPAGALRALRARPAAGEGDAGRGGVFGLPMEHILPWLPPRTRRSSVHPLNVPPTCGRSTAMRRLSPARGQARRDAITPRACRPRTARSRESAAPTCVSCHGVHGAAPPKFGDVDKVCGGACHNRPNGYISWRPDRTATP